MWAERFLLFLQYLKAHLSIPPPPPKKNHSEYGRCSSQACETYLTCKPSETMPAASHWAHRFIHSSTGGYLWRMHCARHRWWNKNKPDMETTLKKQFPSIWIENKDSSPNPTNEQRDYLMLLKREKQSPSQSLLLARCPQSQWTNPWVFVGCTCFFELSRLQGMDTLIHYYKTKEKWYMSKDFSGRSQ